VINANGPYQYTYFEWIRPTSSSPVNSDATATHTSVAVWPSGQQDVFWEGFGGGSIWETSWIPGVGFNPAHPITQVTDAASAPSAAVVTAQNAEVIFYKGTDSNLHEIYWVAGSGWHGPDNLGRGPLG
jgi:hypothetical protein